MQPGLSKCSLLYGVLLFALTVTSLPAEIYGSNHTLTSDLLVSKRAPDFYARILPLGASITLGLRSSTGNGYRKPLRDGLRKEGWEVNMVGSKRNGNMNDNNIEAISGYHIAQIHDLFLLSSKYQPNIVLVNAGNNDAREHDDVDNAGSRLSDMIDTIFADVPGTTVVLSTTVLTANADIEAEREGLNGQIRALVTTRQANGDRIILADMAPSGSTFITASDLDGDGIHPNDGGYSKVAAIWLQAIQEADSQGLIQAPNDTIYPDEGGDDDGSNICDKEYGDGRGPVNTQAGSGLDDGIYRHVSQSMGTKLGFQRTYGDGVFWLAKITRTDRHDIVEYSETESGSSRVYQVFPSDGNSLDDFLCVDTEGNTYVSTNVKSTLTSRGLFKSGASGYEQAGIHFPDIDGDGRHDYCAVAGTGDIHCWRNGGLTDLPEYWQDLGIVFTGKGMGDYLGVRFADINGDGRDDWLWLDDTGKTSIYTNNRGCTKGQEGVDGLTPLWRAAENPTHGGMGVEGARDDVFFGKVFRESQSFGLYGNADYVYLEREETEDGYLSSFNVWKSVGDGGSKLKGNATLEGFSKLAVLTLSGDGTRFCNMMGRSNGADDLFKYSEQKDRANHKFADVNGDGRADFLWTNKFNGDTDVWINAGAIPRPGSAFTWTYQVDGNGRADFSLINSLDNTATTWFNDCPGQDGDGGGDDDDTLTSPDLPTPPGTATATGPPPEKSDFLVQAYNDAQAIANVAKQWPDKFTEVSDLYVGKNFHNSEYKTSFKQNLVAAAEWDTHSWLPFQSYVRVSCDDSQNRCKNKIGSDPRSITAYANNTKSIFGSLVWSITACDPFFTLNHVAQIKRYHESIDPADFELKFMESSGENFLHEAMHLSAITEDRPHIIDSTFDGGKRIYGPKDVARAARIAARDGFDIVARNADTYAVFAQAAYWQDFYGVVIPPENARSSAAPEGAFEIDDVQDSQTNYEDYVIV
ncbi:killer toxin subunits alpha beta [Seiridium cupressi]